MNLSQEWQGRGVRIPVKAGIRNSKMTKNKPQYYTIHNLYPGMQTEREKGQPLMAHCVLLRNAMKALNPSI